MKWETPSDLVAYLRANPSSDVGRASADVIEHLVRQNDSKREIMAHQAKLNEAANAEIERLRLAMRDLMRGYVNTLESGHDRIVALGGVCDSVDAMEASDPHLRAASAALAQGEV